LPTCLSTTPSTVRSSQRVEAAERAIFVDGARIAALSETDPAKLPWAELGVDVVIESTGCFRAQRRCRETPEGGRP